MSNSSQSHGLQPTGLLCPWDFPGKSTGVDCHCLLRDCLWGMLIHWLLPDTCVYEQSGAFRLRAALQNDASSGCWKIGWHAQQWCSGPMEYGQWIYSTCYNNCNRKYPDAGKDWGQEEKGTTEDEMVGWYHQLNRHECKQTPEDSEGQGSLACSSPWGCKEPDMTEWLNNNKSTQD